LVLLSDVLVMFVEKLVNNARIDSRYTNLLKNIYKEVTITVKVQEDVATN